MVTLLRKAEFTGIDIRAVEGFVPDEEDPESEELAQVRERTEHVMPPPDWDQPLPSFPTLGELRYRPIPPSYAEALCSEEDPASLDRSAMTAAREVLFLAAEGSVECTDAIAFVEEVAEFLLVEGRCGSVRLLLNDLGAALPLEPAAAEVLKKLTPKKLIDRYVRAPRHDEPALLSLLALVGGDPMGALIELLGEEHDEERETMLRALLATLAGDEPEAIQAYLADAPPAAAAALFEILRSVAPDRAVDAAFTMLDHPAEDVQLSLLRVFAKAPITARLGLALRATLSSASEAVRIGAAQVLAKRRGAQGFEVLREHAATRADAGMSREEAIAIGRSLAFANPVAARELFHEWTHPKGLRRLIGSIAPSSPGQRMLRFAAVAGLAFAGGSEAAQRIEDVAAKSNDDELGAYCRELASKRHSVKPDG